MTGSMATRVKKQTTVSTALWIGAVVFLAEAALGGVAGAQTSKTFIDYLQPTPITCSPLSSATWGVAGVLPRDTCNGIESAKGAAVPPDYYYWDGQIIKAKDGKYHMFMSTWAGSAGFNPGWQSSGCLPRHQQPGGAGALHAAGVRVHQQRLAQGAQRVCARAAGRNATRSSSARSSPSPSTSRPRSTVRGPRVRRRADSDQWRQDQFDRDLRSWRPLQRHALGLQRQPRGARRRKVRDRAAPRVHRDRRHPVWSLQDAEAHLDLSPGQSSRRRQHLPEADLDPGRDPIQPMAGRRIRTSGTAAAPTTSSIRAPEIASATTFIHPTASRIGRTTAYA